MTALDIPALMALAESATPGPWRTHLVSDILVISEHEEVAQTVGFYDTDHASMEANAAYIAAANPDTILALCRMAEQRQALDQFADNGRRPEEVIEELERQIRIIRTAMEADGAADDAP